MVVVEGLRFSGCRRQYRLLVLCPSNAAQGLYALQPRSPLDSQSSGDAVLLGRGKRRGGHSPQQLGTIATSPPFPMLCCHWESVSVLGVWIGRDPKNTCGHHSCPVISGKGGRWRCVSVCACALCSKEVVLVVMAVGNGGGGGYYHRTTHKECPVDFCAPPPTTDTCASMKIRSSARPPTSCSPL